MVSGLYNAEHVVRAPLFGALALNNGVRWLRASDGRISQFQQKMDLRRAVLTTSYRWDADGRPVDVELELLVPRPGPGDAPAPEACVLRARITPQYKGELWAACPYGVPADAPYGRTATTGVAASQCHEWLVADGRHRVHVAQRLLPSPAFVAGPVAAAPSGSATGANTGNPWSRAEKPVEGAPQKPQRALPAILGRWDAEPGRRLELQRWDALRVVGAKGPGADTLMPGLARRVAAGYDATLAAHARAWGRLWQSDILVDGSPREQQVLHAFLFYLYASAREGSTHSIPPLGLSGTFWGGHIFWDADRWMLPVLMLLHPELADTIVAYRQRTLPGAIANARAEKLPGADYATESAETGREIAPAEFPMEDHNTADVAVAQWEHFLATGAGLPALRSRYWPVLRATADFWASRATWNAQAKRFEVRNLVSPDETAGVVSNDVYTNAMARRNLRVALRAAQLLGQQAPPLWRKVADGLWLPFDAATQRYAEHEGFRPGRRKLKQADAQLLAFPMRLPMDPRARAQLLDFYAPLTSEKGPAMTASIHSVIAADLGRRDEAFRYYQESYKDFLRPPFHLFSEKRPTDNTNFLTGQAGTLMSVLYGFAGVHLEGIEEGTPRLSVRPLLPPGWNGLTVKGLHFRGKVQRLKVAADGSYTLTAEGSATPARADGVPAGEGARAWQPGPPGPVGPRSLPRVANYGKGCTCALAAQPVRPAPAS
jgi:trehalose/maltose hydrolase-like predicted phosphorylase